MSITHWRLLGLLMLAESVAAVETSMVYTGLGAWMRIYGDPIAVGWIVSSYLFVSAALVALCARFGDLFGRKRILVAIIGIAALGSAISATASDLTGIIIGRAMQGVTGATLPLCYGLVRELLPDEKRSLGVGFLVATAAIGGAFGLVLGGVFTDTHGPQSMFVFSAILATVVAIIVAIGLPASLTRSTSRHIDWVGGFLFAPGVVALMLSISSIKKWGATSPEVLGLAACGAAIIAFWAWWELREKEPMIDVRLLAKRECLLPNIVMVCGALGIMNITQHTSLLLQQDPATGAGLGVSATFVGLLKFPAVAAGVPSSIWAGWIAGKRGGAFPMVIGCAVMFMATAMGALMHDSVLMITLALVLGLWGVTAMYAGVPSVIIAAAPADRTSEATGVMAVLRAVGQAVGAQLLAVILALSTVTNESGKEFPSDLAYTLGFWWMAAVSACGLFVSWLLLRSEKSTPAVKTAPVEAAASVNPNP